VATGKQLAAVVVEMAERWGVPPAHVAFAYALAHPNLASVVFGSTSAEQLRDNVAALETFDRLDHEQIASIRALAR
jgi:aryl-alcohol dehydrogenase-like predicted oxidoreductase